MCLLFFLIFCLYYQVAEWVDGHRKQREDKNSSHPFSFCSSYPRPARLLQTFLFQTIDQVQPQKHTLSMHLHSWIFIHLRKHLVRVGTERQTQKLKWKWRDEGKWKRLQALSVWPGKTRVLKLKMHKRKKKSHHDPASWNGEKLYAPVRWGEGQCWKSFI